MLGVKYCFTANSGTTAFYIILNALKKLSDKKEVLLPAYTAPSLILPIRKAGLNYRLVDISLDTFNMDVAKTLASISTIHGRSFVHMFGIPMNIKSNRSKGVFIIEMQPPPRNKKGNAFSSTLGI
jgi:dTDP-4-amino-4,6-dideoxygalactose transaminase